MRSLLDTAEISIGAVPGFIWCSAVWYGVEWCGAMWYKVLVMASLIILVNPFLMLGVSGEFFSLYCTLYFA